MFETFVNCYGFVLVILTAFFSYTSGRLGRRMQGSLYHQFWFLYGLIVPVYGLMMFFLAVYRDSFTLEEGLVVLRFLKWVVFSSALAWVLGNLTGFRLDLRRLNLPKAMEAKSDRLGDRALAAVVNFLALPFFAGCALLVFGIAMAMRFGGRASR